ncbi:hypothetical protein NS206_00280 [Microbacterium testaceum]|nr:hypothetical protein NS206_00280 [Microbacterium testaceum]
MKVTFAETLFVRRGGEAGPQRRVLPERFTEWSIELSQSGFAFNTAFEHDDKAVRLATTVAVSEPGIYNLAASLPDRESSQVLTSRLDLDMSRSLRLDRDVLESFGYERLGLKITCNQSRGQPSCDGMLKVEPPASPGAASRSTPLVDEAVRCIRLSGGV